MTTKNNTFKLHFIGTGMYTSTIFEREAKRIGVQRAVAFTQLKSLNFGTPVLLATFIPRQAPTTSTSNNAIPAQAEIFGYFTIDGLSHTLPKDLSQQLTEKLNIVKVDANSFSVSRACGSYSVGSITYIKDTLPQLLEKIKELFTVHKPNVSQIATKDQVEVCTCKLCVSEDNPTAHNSIDQCVNLQCDCCTHVNYSQLNSYKWFLNGAFHPLTPFILSPAKFARGLQTVIIDNLDLNAQRKASHPVVWVYNYRQRHYLPKTMKDNLQRDKDSFSNVF